MKQKNRKNYSYWLGVIVVGIALGFAIQFVRAWTEPTAAPPGGNVAAPINTGNIDQTKTGDICTTAPNGTGVKKCLSTASGSATPFCGDHSCNNGETCSTCPGDCGACPGCTDFYGGGGFFAEGSTYQTGGSCWIGDATSAYVIYYACIGTTWAKTAVITGGCSGIY